MRIHYCGLVGHPDVNVDLPALDRVGLYDVMYELASQLGSATDPVVPGSVAHGIWAPQRDAIQARYDECAALCEQRDIPVTGVDDTRASAAGDRRWRERTARAHERRSHA